VTPARSGSNGISIRLAVASTLLLSAGCDQVFSLEREEAGFTCASSFEPVEGSYLQRIRDPLTWVEANDACRALQGPDDTGYGHLAVMSSDAEFAAAQGYYTLTNVWLGHTDLAVEGTFHPVSAEPFTWPTTTAPWARDQPNNLDGRQNCLWVDDNGRLDDKTCDSVYESLCECDAFPVP